METTNQKCTCLFFILCALSILLKLMLNLAMAPASVMDFRALVWSKEEFTRNNPQMPQHAIYRDLRPFLRATEKSVTGTKPPIYLADVKNPCFALTDGYINVGNIDVMTALQMELEIRCVPAVYVAGTTFTHLYQ